MGLKVLLVAKVGDQRSSDHYEGFAEVLIDEPRVQLNFIGPDTKLIDAEIPFDTLVMDSIPSWGLNENLYTSGCSLNAGRL